MMIAFQEGVVGSPTRMEPRRKANCTAKKTEDKLEALRIQGKTGESEHHDVSRKGSVRETVEVSILAEATWNIFSRIISGHKFSLVPHRTLETSCVSLRDPLPFQRSHSDKAQQLLCLLATTC